MAIGLFVPPWGSSSGGSQGSSAAGEGGAGARKGAPIIIIVIIVSIVIIIIMISSSGRNNTGAGSGGVGGLGLRLPRLGREIPYTKTRDRHRNNNYRVPFERAWDPGGVARPWPPRWFKCTRTFWYYNLMFVLTSKHKHFLPKEVTSTKKSTHIRNTYKRECYRESIHHHLLKR